MQPTERGRPPQELVRLRRYGLISVDEVGYIPFERDAANLFFQRVSTRCEHASLILARERNSSRTAVAYEVDLRAQPRTARSPEASGPMLSPVAGGLQPAGLHMRSFSPYEWPQTILECAGWTSHRWPSAADDHPEQSPNGIHIHWIAQREYCLATNSGGGTK